MTRSEIRYLLFQMKDYEERTDLSEPNLPEGFKESFLSNPNFRGWSAFGITWDVDQDNPWKIVFRDKSIEQEWNETLLEIVPELPASYINGIPSDVYETLSEEEINTIGK